MILEIIVGIITFLFILAGLVGIFVPALPGNFLIFIGILFSLLFGGITKGELYILIALSGLLVLSFLLDYLSTYIAARKLGASKIASVSAVVGSIIGFFIFGLLGTVIFGFLFAVIVDLLIKKEFKKAVKAGIGVFLGMIISQIGNIIIALLMIGIFIKYLV